MLLDHKLNVVVAPLKGAGVPDMNASVGDLDDEDYRLNPQVGRLGGERRHAGFCACECMCAHTHMHMCALHMCYVRTWWYASRHADKRPQLLSISYLSS